MGRRSLLLVFFLFLFLILFLVFLLFLLFLLLLFFLLIPKVALTVLIFLQKKLKSVFLVELESGVFVKELHLARTRHVHGLLRLFRV